MSSCLTLFEDNDVPRGLLKEDEENFLVSNFKKSAPASDEDALPVVKEKEDNVLKKIFANTRQGPRQKKRELEAVKIIPEYEPFCFNASIKIKYPQTPHFKNQLQSPFWKFNAEHKTHMESLRQKTIKSDFQSVDLNADPLCFVGESLRYFAGVGVNLKEKECINASRALMKLGCYAEPFNERAWKKYIES